MADQKKLEIEVDSAVADEAEELFRKMGLDTKTAVNVFLRSCIRESGIPFSITLHSIEQERTEENARYYREGFQAGYKMNSAQ